MKQCESARETETDRLETVSVPRQHIHRVGQRERQIDRQTHRHTHTHTFTNSKPAILAPNDYLKNIDVRLLFFRAHIFVHTYMFVHTFVNTCTL